MTTSFPGALDSYTLKVDNVTDIMAADVNDLQDAVVAIETALGASVGNITPLNLFINGGFDIWQRTTNDTAVTTTRKYVADRWAVTTGAGTLANVQRSTTVRTGARSTYSLEMVGAVGVTTVNVDQRIEAAIAGRYKRTLYFSAYVYNGSGASFTPKIYVSTPSAADNWTTSTVRNGGGSGENLQACADAAWTKVTWSADVSGYTNIGNGLEVRIEIPSGSLVASDTVRLAEMNLTPGTAAAFEQRPIGSELGLCQRYFYKTYEAATVPGTSTTNGVIQLMSRNAVGASSAGAVRFTLRWLSTMRTTPTVVVYSSDGTANACRNNTVGNNRTGVTAGGVGDGGLGSLVMDNTSANAIALDDNLFFHCAASAEL